MDANAVFRANKFLDFKDKDSLVESIDGLIYKSTDLNRYFGAKQDWKRIEAEDTSSYRKPVERYATTQYSYAYTDTSMTESFDNWNAQYNMKTSFKSTWNPKGFLIYTEKKTFIDNKLVRTISTTNTFNSNNRVISILENSVYSGREKKSQSMIKAFYTDSEVTVTSDHGTIVCKLYSDGKTKDRVSDLSARETAEQFLYHLRWKRLDEARKHCTEKLAKALDNFRIFKYDIEDLQFVRGSNTFNTTGITITDIWKIKFAKKVPANYTVDFDLVKQSNGWKIEDFKIKTK